MIPSAKEKPGRPPLTNPTGSLPPADGLVSLKQLAAELGMDRSSARKYLLRQGFKPKKRRLPDAKRQLCLSLTGEEVEKVVALRAQEGFTRPETPVDNGAGFLYVVRPWPDRVPHRVKLGFAVDVSARLAHYRTMNPEVEVVRTWPCRREWEATAICSMTRVGCKHVMGEVFNCPDLASLLARGKDFFRQMPGLEEKE